MLSLIFTSFVFAGDYEKEEKVLKKEFIKNFPQLEKGKNIKIKKLDVSIEEDGGVEVEVEFTKESKINIKNYPVYAEKMSVAFKEKIKKSFGDRFYLEEIDIETPGLKEDKVRFGY